jgi:hypothetical protein
MAGPLQLALHAEHVVPEGKHLDGALARRRQHPGSGRRVQHLPTACSARFHSTWPARCHCSICLTNSSGSKPCSHGARPRCGGESRTAGQRRWRRAGDASHVLDDLRPHRAMLTVRRSVTEARLVSGVCRSHGHPGYRVRVAVLRRATAKAGSMIGGCIKLY